MIIQGESKMSDAEKWTAELEKTASSLGMKPADELHTSDEVKRLAHKGWETGQLSKDEVKSLCGSVMRHIERHTPSKKDV